MRFHTPPAPLSHTRAAARAECREQLHEELLSLILELALACLEGAALGRAVMALQDAADDSEARAADALDLAAHRAWDIRTMSSALEAVTSFARLEEAELVAASRWAAHVSSTHELAQRALKLTS
jgi:hypothetical protein